MNVKFSVLMSVHSGENPGYLDQCLDSINSQILPPDEIVLVEDGPLTAALYDVIARWQDVFGGGFKPVILGENLGFAEALNKGLEQCFFDWVARMDTDDAAYSERFMEQMNFIENNPGVDVVGAWIEEYDDNMDSATGIRKVPETHDEIVRFGKWRSPLNHMTVVYRREAVLKASGYPRHLRKMQDYGLWAKLILSGARFHNIAKPLVRVRAGAEFLVRRGGINYCVNEMLLFSYLRKIGFLSLHELVFGAVLRISVRIMPAVLRRTAYRLIRKNLVFH